MSNVNTVFQVGWSVFGLVTGYTLGRYHAYIQRKRASMANPPPDSPPTPADGPGAAHAPRPRDWGSIARTGLGILILLLVVVSLVSFYRVTSCQAGYNVAVARSIAARSDQQGTQLQRQIDQLDAQLVLLTPWDGDKNDIAAQRAEGERRGNIYRASVEANRDALIAVRDARQRNPLPDPETCGDATSPR